MRPPAPTPSTSDVEARPEVPLYMPIAFKEWAVAVGALAGGEQLITLRKGGIVGGNKHFESEHDRFFAYPTFDHQQGQFARVSHRPEVSRAIEEGIVGVGAALD